MSWRAEDRAERNESGGRRLRRPKHDQYFNSLVVVQLPGRSSITLRPVFQNAFEGAGLDTLKSPSMRAELSRGSPSTPAVCEAYTLSEQRGDYFSDSGEGNS
jgi:hypothetical protein